MLKAALILFTILTIFSLQAQTTSSVCEQIQIISTESIQFTATEQRLLCGDDESRAYQQIPLFQAEFHLRSFLEARAYLNPSFEKQNKKLIVSLGEQYQLQALKINAQLEVELQDQIQKFVIRFFQNSLMTPALLDQIEASVQSLLANQGHACAKVRTVFDVNEKLLTIEIENSQTAVFGEVEQDKLDGLSPQVISRSRPFKPHHPYRQFYLRIHEKRLNRSGVVQGNFYRRQCENNAPVLRHSFVLGPPRVLRFGAGFNSEVGPLLRARWTHQRKGYYAHRLEAQIETSYRQQQINASLMHFAFKKWPRAFGQYGLDLIREEFKNYEEIQLILKPHLGLNWDSRHAFNEFIFGPNATTSSYKIDRDKRSLNETSGAFEFNFRRTTHLYEDKQIHPSIGSQLLVNAEFRHPALGFDYGLARLKTSFVSLHPVMTWGRGELILGQKLILGTTLQSQDQRLEDLAPSLKFYAGGSHDVRGHGLNELPSNNGTGALTKIVLRLEARKTAFLRDDLELAIFFDSARLSEKSLSTTGETPYSPGIALRWDSPIGLIQTYAARTLFSRPTRDEGMLYFIGLGGGL